MRYYFLGIAGTAMASLAVLLKMKGHEVWGTDQGIYPPMSDFLKENKIAVNEGYSRNHLKELSDLVVIGNSLSRGNEEIEEILDRRLRFISLPELIHDEFVRSHHSIVITGTHGKTSITALLSWIFEVAGLSPAFLIGGVAKNFSSSVKLGKGKYFIIEGDEYDSAFFDKRPKFLHYFPRHLIINNIEFDHADIFQDLNNIKDEFRKLLRLVPGTGMIVANSDDNVVKEVLQSRYSRLQLFGEDIQSDWSFDSLKINGTETHFDLLHSGKLVDHFVLSQPGRPQVQNALGAIAIANDVGVNWDSIKAALRSFKGVKRRLEHWGKLNGAIVIDDFAHHPTAIRKTLQVIREIYPQERIIALFEPRTNTTVRNIFQEELAQALCTSDGVLITPVHRPERIPSEKRLSLPKIVQTLEDKNKFGIAMESYSQIPKLLMDILRRGDVLVLLTNGSLGGYYSTIHEMVEPD